MAGTDAPRLHGFGSGGPPAPGLAGGRGPRRRGSRGHLHGSRPALGRDRPSAPNCVKKWSQGRRSGSTSRKGRRLLDRRPGRTAPRTWRSVVAVRPQPCRDEVYSVPRLGTPQSYTRHAPELPRRLPHPVGGRLGGQGDRHEPHADRPELDGWPGRGTVEPGSIYRLGHRGDVEKRLALPPRSFSARGPPPCCAGGARLPGAGPSAAGFCRRLPKADSCPGFSLAPAPVLSARITRAPSLAVGRHP